MSPSRFRRFGARRVVVGAIATVVVLAGGAVAWSATGASAAASYRSATATRGSVQQTLTATGTVTPRHQADLSFGTAGTVRAVTAAVGDRVGIGETLALLDRTALRDAVISAKAAVAKAKATLVSDKAAQAAAVTAAANPTSSQRPVSGSSPSANGSTSSGNGSSSASSAATRKTPEKLAKEQAALLAAQHDADAALQVASAALKQQAAACAGVLAPSDPAATPAADVAACQAALGAVQAAQAKVAAAQQKVEAAIATLARSLTTALGSVSPKASTPASSNGGSSKPASQTSAGHLSTATFSSETAVTYSAASVVTGDPQPDGSSGGSDASQSATVTASTLARDQSAIDSARAALVRAAAALDRARLASPIAGTVAAIDVAPGDSVSSSTVAVVVNGDDGNVEITIDVTENDIRAIKVGQSALVSADGAQDALPATVTSVGLLSASDSGTASYPVVVALAGAPMSLASGSDASVSVVIATAANVVTVPSSAVTRTANGTTGVVRVLKGDQVTTARVVIGAVGPVRTQIVSGLKAGQRVVLADFSAALPSSSTDARPGGGFGGGGFDGGQRTFTSRTGNFAPRATG